MPSYYEIAIEVDGHRRSGKWTLRQGGRVFVTCAWGVHTLDCCPPARPEIVAAQALEEIVRTYHRERAAMLAEDARAVAAVNAYWDKQKGEQDPPP